MYGYKYCHLPIAYTENGKKWLGELGLCAWRKYKHTMCMTWEYSSFSLPNQSCHSCCEKSKWHRPSICTGNVYLNSHHQMVYRKKVDQRNSQMECYKKHLSLVWFTENVIRLGERVRAFYVRMFSSVDEICNFNYRTGITHYADWIDRHKTEWASVCVCGEYGMTFAIV